MLSDEQRRFAKSDAGKDILQQALWYRTGHLPIGNVNFGMILQAVDWGWIARGGLTKSGRKALTRYTEDA